MKKNLILMTALFAGSMIVNDGFGGRDLITVSPASKSAAHNPMQVVALNNNTQRDLERVVNSQQQLNENKDKVKNEESKEEQQTVIQSDFEGSDVEKMDAASAIPPVELVNVLSQDVVTKEEEKKDSVSVESSEDLNGNDSNKIDGTDTISVEPEAVLSQDVTNEEEQKDQRDVAQNGDSANQTSLKGSECGKLSSSGKKKLQKSAPRPTRNNERART